MKRLGVWISLAALAPVISSDAAEAAFLTPQQAVAGIVDGRPWTARTRDGHDAALTLDDKGGGRFAAGPMSFNVRWSVQRNAICIDVGPAGEKCLRFKATANGYEGWNGERLDLSLSR